MKEKGEKEEEKGERKENVIIKGEQKKLMKEVRYKKENKKMEDRISKTNERKGIKEN